MRGLLTAAVLALSLAACAGNRHPLLNPSLGNLHRIPLPPAKLKVMRLVQEKLASGDADHISVFYQCLSTGYWFGINEHEKFIPASLMKAYIMIMALKAAEEAPELLETRLEYKDYSYLFAPGRKPEQSVTPRNQFVFGRQYTVDKLLFQMMSQSDNNAAYNLQIYLGDERFAKVLYDYGISIPDNDDPFVSVKNYMMMLLSLYNASYLSVEMSQRALGYLVRSNYDAGIAVGVPQGVRIANKFGERRLVTPGGDTTQLHDCGVVYHPRAPYLLGVMTRGKDMEKQRAIIAEVSKLVYSEVDSGSR